MSYSLSRHLQWIHMDANIVDGGKKMSFLTCGHGLSLSSHFVIACCFALPCRRYIYTIHTIYPAFMEVVILFYLRGCTLWCCQTAEVELMVLSRNRQKPLSCRVIFSKQNLLPLFHGLFELRGKLNINQLSDVFLCAKEVPPPPHMCPIEL